MTGFRKVLIRPASELGLLNGLAVYLISHN
jgi:hypothetical protein